VLSYVVIVTFGVRLWRLSRVPRFQTERQGRDLAQDGLHPAGISPSGT